MFALSLVLVAVLWELYKASGPQDGGKLFGVHDPAPRERPGDAARVGDPVALRAIPSDGRPTSPSALVVLAARGSPFRLALAGFAIGASSGRAGRR